jgi:tetratricopeptide (TPR) repeat protein
MTDRFGASPEFLERQGDMAFLQGRTDEAEELWQRAVELRPNARLHQMLAGAADRRGDAAAATRHRGRQEYFLGLQSYRDNKELDAVQHFEQAVKLDPQQPGAWFYMGELQRESGHAQEAVQCYQKYLALHPHSGKALDALAELGDAAAEAN